jgi:hypothetical protein
MKIIATEGGRVLDLVPLEEIRPLAGIYVPDLIKAITERYGFAAGPTNLAEAVKSGAKFEHGKFITDGGSVVIKELAIYSDGLISDAFDTRTADRVLDDFLDWATEQFKLRERESPRRRTYTSALICEFERPVESALGNLSKLCGLLSKSLNAAYGWNHEYNLNRLGFSVDPMTAPHLRNTQFVIERRVQSPYSENRYYSGAPLQTEVHIQLLETIERELVA